MKCSDEPEKFAGERIQDGDRGGREGEGAERPETGLVGGEQSRPSAGGNVAVTETTGSQVVIKGIILHKHFMTQQ